jgi:hypothetical protein
MARKKTAEEAPEEPKAKQGHLPEMEPPSIPEIESAADAFVRARNKWQRAHQPMMEAQENLHTVMREKGQRRYEYDSKIVEVVAGSEKVKVKAAKEEGEDDDD